MSQVFNLYCDESCHLENDHQPVMVLGTVWCLQEKARETAVRLREIKTAHGLPSDFELKWTKVSPAKLGFYMEVLNYFFDDDDLHFRAWVAHKAGLRHADFGQTHADWYYKMMFGLMEPLLWPPNTAGTNTERNIMPTGPHEKAEAAPCGTASLLLQHMVDELREVSATSGRWSSAVFCAFHRLLRDGVLVEYPRPDRSNAGDHGGWSISMMCGGMTGWR